MAKTYSIQLTAEQIKRVKSGLMADWRNFNECGFTSLGDHDGTQEDLNEEAAKIDEIFLQLNLAQGITKKETIYPTYQDY